jgi:hypothetical protein
MKKALILLVASLFGLVGSAQVPIVAWENTIGGNWGDGCNDMVPISDGGFLLGGGSASDAFGDKTEANIGESDVWLVKTDAQGIVQWDVAIGGTANENLISLDTTTDGGFILGCVSNSGISGDKTEANIGDYDYWILKTDALGNIEWQNTIGGSGFEQVKTVYETEDEGFIVAGHSLSGISGDKTEPNYGGALGDIWILKLDGNGEILWQNTIGGTGDDYLLAARAGLNGSIYLAATSNSNIGVDKTENSNGGSADYWAVKLNSTGNIEWQNTIGGNDADDMADLLVTSDGGALLIGTSRSNISGDKTEDNIGLNDFWIVKIDNQGNVEWDETIGGDDSDDAYEVTGKGDAYLISGISKSGISGDKSEANYGNWDYWVIEIDNSGNVLWQKTIGGNDWDVCYAMDLAEDGGIVLGGSSGSGISGDKSEADIGNGDYWVVKIGPEMITGLNLPSLTLPQSWDCRIYNMAGQLVLFEKDKNSISNKGTGLPAGLYIREYLDRETGNSILKDKLVINE